jgi:hypothetical protein
MSGDDAGIQTQGHQLGCPVVGAGAGLLGDYAARWQLGAPGYEFVVG